MPGSAWEGELAQVWARAEGQSSGRSAAPMTEGTRQALGVFITLVVVMGWFAVYIRVSGLTKLYTLYVGSGLHLSFTSVKEFK